MLKQSILTHYLRNDKKNLGKFYNDLMITLNELEKAQYGIIKQMLSVEKFSKVYNIDIPPVADHVTILEHIKNQKIVLWTSLLPPNLFTLETGQAFAEYKNIMENSIISIVAPLKESFNSMLIVYEASIGKFYDLDNYYFKGYTDALMKSGLVKDDNYKNVKFFLEGIDSDKLGVKIGIYNCQYLNNYINDIIKK